MCNIGVNAILVSPCNVSVTVLSTCMDDQQCFNLLSAKLLTLYVPGENITIYVLEEDIICVDTGHAHLWTCGVPYEVMILFTREAPISTGNKYFLMDKNVNQGFWLCGAM